METVNQNLENEVIPVIVRVVFRKGTGVGQCGQDRTWGESKMS